MRSAVLVVEDDARLRDVIEGLLVDEGYDVGTADSVESARKAVQGPPFDCVVLDLNLPEERGIALMDAWSDLESSPSVVVLSGAIDAPKIAREYGVMLVRKPYELEVLLAAVKLTLGQKIRPAKRLRR